MPGLPFNLHLPEFTQIHNQVGDVNYQKSDIREINPQVDKPHWTATSEAWPPEAAGPLCVLGCLAEL